MRILLVPLLLTAATFAAPTEASAHVIITSHETRDGMMQIKSGPCGREGSTRGENIHVFTAGETITLTFNEFIPHPGYYRISFDDDGQDDFVDPADYDDLYTNDTVLVDNLYPHESRDVSGEWSYDLTLPDVECDNCTIQLVQMMTDKPPYTMGGNDLYYNCLDVVLEAPGGDDAGAGDAGEVDGGEVDEVDGGEVDGGGSDAAAPDAGEDDAVSDSQGTAPDASEPGTEDGEEGESSGGGCSAAGGRSGGGALFVGLCVAALARRRRSLKVALPSARWAW
jgi:hypothetical protein